MTKLSLSIAKRLLEEAEKKAEEIGVPMVIAIVDEGGNFVASHRMDDALLASIDISINKAWTSAALKMPTETLSNLSQSGGELFGIHTTNNGRIVLFGGGIPLKVNEQIVGAIGVSGGAVADDIEVAQAAVSLFHSLQHQ
ncbi:heme-binding protein [Alteribacillus sp. YIM 98480]|uniref:GlcG/HbpS family heme-binding protein n=1 Tax=Alteribacillus sp. YIM 98480 TaxID=2606599 RepID=UPI00131ACB7C|nr:heme-binding protein [Alteribacillus sp. YIM 98480]